jgi:hypothetical protein
MSTGTLIWLFTFGPALVVLLGAFALDHFLAVNDRDEA